MYWLQDHSKILFFLWTMWHELYRADQIFPLLKREAKMSRVSVALWHHLEKDSIVIVGWSLSIEVLYTRVTNWNPVSAVNHDVSPRFIFIESNNKLKPDLIFLTNLSVIRTTYDKKQCGEFFFFLVHVLSMNKEEAGSMTYTSASHQGRSRCFGFNFREPSCCLSVYGQISMWTLKTHYVVNVIRLKSHLYF